MSLSTPQQINLFNQSNSNYVGTIIGESTSREFRIAVTPETIREQDIIAVDAELKATDHYSNNKGVTEKIRIWAKVQRIERLNPLFPSEAGHELANTRTNPIDTVMSLSREMVTAVCQVLGYEPIDENTTGKLSKLRYPPKPATSPYRPQSQDVKRVVLGELQQKKNRSLDIATLANRSEVDVTVDGHAIVSRHLAILAMTGAGKSWTARRIIEELSKKNYPIVIFDPHGDYTGLSDIPSLKDRVKRYYAQFPIFNEDSDNVAQIVSNLGYELTPTMQGLFSDIFNAAKSFYSEDKEELKQRVEWLADYISDPDCKKYGVKPNLWLVAHIAKAGELILRTKDQNAQEQLKEWGWNEIINYKGKIPDTLEGIKKRTYAAAKALSRMEQTNQKVARSGAIDLPTDRKDLVKYGQISVISLAGYTGDFQATIYSLIADDIFTLRVRDELKLRVLLLLEEAHNFAPAKARPHKMILESLQRVREEFKNHKFHVFGIGGTSTLHIAALLGIDSCDSSGWRNRAVRGLIQLPGTGDRIIADLGNWRGRRINDIEREKLKNCQCPSCQQYGIEGLEANKMHGFVNRATHNLWILLEEVRQIEEHLPNLESYQQWYQTHLDNTMYRPLIAEILRQKIDQ